MVLDAPPALRLTLRPILATTPDSLEALNAAELQDGALAFVTAVAAGGTLSGLYRWALGDTTAPSPPNVIADARNTGRWIALPGGGGGGGVTSVTGTGGVIVDPTTGAVVVGNPWGALVRDFTDLSSQFVLVGSRWQVDTPVKLSGALVLPAGQGIEFVGTGWMSGIGVPGCSISGDLAGPLVIFAAGAAVAQLEELAISNASGAALEVPATRAAAVITNVLAEGSSVAVVLDATSAVVTSLVARTTAPTTGALTSTGGLQRFVACTFDADAGVGCLFSSAVNGVPSFVECVFTGDVGVQGVGTPVAVSSCRFSVDLGLQDVQGDVRDSEHLGATALLGAVSFTTLTDVSLRGNRCSARLISATAATLAGCALLNNTLDAAAPLVEVPTLTVTGTRIEGNAVAAELILASTSLALSSSVIMGNRGAAEPLVSSPAGTFVDSTVVGNVGDDVVLSSAAISPTGCVFANNIGTGIAAGQGVFDFAPGPTRTPQCRIFANMNGGVRAADWPRINASIQVAEPTDLPAPVAGVITLDAGVKYEVVVENLVLPSDNRIVMTAGSALWGPGWSVARITFTCTTPSLRAISMTEGQVYGLELVITNDWVGVHVSGFTTDPRGVEQCRIRGNGSGTIGIVCEGTTQISDCVLQDHFYHVEARGGSSVQVISTRMTGGGYGVAITTDGPEDVLAGECRITNMFGSGVYVAPAVPYVGSIRMVNNRVATGNYAIEIGAGATFGAAFVGSNFMGGGAGFASGISAVSANTIFRANFYNDVPITETALIP